MLMLFDLDGVLYDIDVEERARGFARLGADAALVRAWFDSAAERAADAGDPADPREYLARFCAATGARATLREWGEVRRAAMTPRRRSLAAFSIAASAGIAAVLTNNPSALGPVFAVVAPEVEQLVGAAGLVLSAQIGVQKPDPRIYRAAMTRFGEQPGDTFFTDDAAENAEAAAALGITAHRFDGDEGALLAAVQEFIRERG